MTDPMKTLRERVAAKIAYWRSSQVPPETIADDVISEILSFLEEPTEEMWRAGWQQYHPWKTRAPKPEDRPNGYAAMKGDFAPILRAMLRTALAKGGE